MTAECVQWKKQTDIYTTMSNSEIFLCSGHLRILGYCELNNNIVENIQF